MDESIAERRARVSEYDFREVHPFLHFGTASDRFAGWIGQIYPLHYEEEIESRSKRMDGQIYEERTIPVQSVRDYFEHFNVLEIDFTFYSPLLGQDGTPTSTLKTLQQYAEYAPEDALFLLKVPQMYFARKLRRSKKGQGVSYEDNPNFLHADAYIRQFLDPALDVLGERLQGVLFQQEYQRVQDAPSPEDNIAELDAFFAQIPGTVQSHIELRSPHLLVRPYFDWLESRGIGFIFSHWTWLPQIRRQWQLCEGRFTAADGTCVARLLTPLDMSHAEAYSLTHPFDKPVDAITGTKQAREMVLDVTALTYRAEDQGVLLNVIANNPAWGNAPALAQAIAHRVLDEEEKRAM